MADQYTDFVNSPFGRNVARKLGLPAPARLRRHTPGDSLVEGPVLVAGDGPYGEGLRVMVAAAGVRAVASLEEAGDERLGGLVLDLSPVREPAELARLRELGAPAVKRLAPNARVVVLGTDHTVLTDPVAVASQRALDGFVRSLAKELRAGATANLVYGPPPAADAQGTEAEAAHRNVGEAVRFFLSGRSAFVDGQTVRVDATSAPVNPSVDRPLEGKVAVVTGAARGIGAAIARTLHRDGATVVCVDVPAAGEQLAAVASEVRGTALQLDVTAPDAGRRIVEHARGRHGSLDIVVHNAGITRDKLFVNMDDARWDSVMAVNLESILRINEALLGEGGLADGGRIVCLSSQSGFGGNRGQTNYSATKSAIIGLVSSLAPGLRDRGITVNGVAPGLIETEMTAAMPFATREAGRRLSSLQQGGQPVDVAETIAWLAQPGSAGITGQVVRVCGQNFLGA
ncbi:3-oxoacyl-ACP reductase [Arsenicicoccus dermatophilus]|uniref:3-oxoacyl-ACP reductase n=1 Tax=Arsenicicoccus dermatophilus TaxID=1076331 RepID=UPI001F4CC573|nr:3-oxoacyl-ACP reductase [Arsenicicoccus dermatophilus]MCH8611768.1 3-oxoacyl-ACP reductase [Arsenicicoccus dermatophilus]